jgi:hemerythrin-like domain-containing protein
MTNHNLPANPRRLFLQNSGALLGLAIVGAPALLAGCASKAEPLAVPPTEELMREHGVISRLLLIFDEMARRLKCCQELSPATLAEAAALTKGFIQDHHEKLEEEHIFPPFEKAGKMVALVQILRRQHDSGRKLIDYIAAHSSPGDKNFVQRAQLEASITLFTRMYRPHAAREDTLLFPALRTLLTPDAFTSLGDQFAAAEREAHGTDAVLSQINDLEKTLGLHDLEDFTPRL